LKLGRDVDLKLPHAEQFDEGGTEYNPSEIDDKWVAKNKKTSKFTCILERSGKMSGGTICYVC